MAQTHAVQVQDPLTGRQIAEVPFATQAEIRKALDLSQEAFRRLKETTAYQRSQVLENAARELETRRDEFAELMRSEAGKPITYAQAEVTRAIGILQWAAAEALRFSGELLRLDSSSTGRPGFGIHARFPRGLILGITPFNFPLNLVVHKVAPAIAVGCPILIKPSPYTPLTAMKFAELFRSVPGQVQVVMADTAATAELTRAPEVKMISFTGSARVGWLIKRQAPEKPATLELGGNAWVIIHEDIPESLFAPIAKRVATAGFGYAGQSCISVQNVAVHRSIREPFLNALAEATRSLPFGDTQDPKVVSGPVIRKTAADRIRASLSEAKEDRKFESTARMGHPLAEGTLIAPTLVELKGVNSLTSPLVQEELFGPVMSFSGYDRLDDCLSWINSSRYGLQAGIFTQHLPSIERTFRVLDVGGVVVNDVPTTRYDHQPYGGIKESGEGREGVRYAMEEMTQSKFLALSSNLPL